MRKPQAVLDPLDERGKGDATLYQRIPPQQRLAFSPLPHGQFWVYPGGYLITPARSIQKWNIYFPFSRDKPHLGSDRFPGHQHLAALFSKDESQQHERLYVRVHVLVIPP